MRLAREYEASEGRDLGGFLASAAESTERDEREGMAAVQAEGHDGVRVMTVHAAKGLEFPVVAVPDLGRGLAAGHRHGDLVIGPPPVPGEPEHDASGCGSRSPRAKSFGLWELTDLNEAESVAEAEEGCRLTYVAASRAEDRLILSGAYKPSDARARRAGEAERLAAAPPAARARGGRGWDGGAQIVTLPGARPIESTDRLPEAALEIRISEPSPERAAELVRRFDPPPEPEPLAGVVAPPPLVEARARARAGRPPLLLGAGALRALRLPLLRRAGARRPRAASRPGRRAPTTSEAEPRATSSPSPRCRAGLALGLGNAVHAALEWSARRGWEAPPRRADRARCSPREGLERRRRGGAPRGRARRGLARLAAAAPSSASGVGLRPEVPFVLGLGPHGDPRADRPAGRARRRAADGRRLQDRRARAAASPAELAERYRAQREVYALAAGDRGARVAARLPRGARPTRSRR